ncbi:hypothetical protein I551_2431 [Mycobacterium ulcerans str. Harvey]|uniref:Uncharacterized protein n=1 Tax=Mycobacterium ulcerans str. Harvey TaxID=1299332 RepID=A0ABN0R2M3_MYCUL|nr:hypothetical protein I551_2431 [Mycobacterium ulcerans str. Harvey]
MNIGTFSQSVSEGLNGEAHDIGLITLDSGKIPQSPAIKAAVPVTGIATDLKVGQLLCKFGMKTGRAECGQVTDISASKVAFLAASECGDSGARSTAWTTMAPRWRSAFSFGPAMPTTHIPDARHRPHSQSPSWCAPGWTGGA